MSESPFQTLRSLVKRGALDEARQTCFEALRRGSFSGEEIEAVGRLLMTRVKPSEPPELNLLLLGQYTTSFMVPVLTAEACARGCAVSVHEGGYDNLLQDLHALETPADLVILLPSSVRLFAPGERTLRQRIDDELQFLGQAWELVRRRKAGLVQVGYDWMDAGAEGLFLGGAEDGALAMLDALNRELRGALGPNDFFVDLERLAGRCGRERFYDRRNYYWTRQPFSTEGLVVLCRYLWAAVRAVRNQSKKVAVLDLDNTLWGGIVGETGAARIGLGGSPEGEAFRAFQQYLQDLRGFGVLLAVCSKNNLEDALEPFSSHPDMVLSHEDIASFQASWSPKPVMLQRIAGELNLGLDSFVFLDDNPAEREAVRQALPQVEVVELPPDPSDYISALEAGHYFERLPLTVEDQMRGDQYAAEQARHSVMDGEASLESFLVSLEMCAEVEHVGAGNLPRVLQLIGKTNQWNLTTRRHTEAGVQTLLAGAVNPCMALRLRDRFGDYGLISVLLTQEGDSPDTLEIDTWLMSCRAIGRTVEHYLFNHLAATAVALGYRKLRGTFIPTAKNAQVADWYERLGFSALEDCYELDLEKRVEQVTFVRDAEGT